MSGRLRELLGRVGSVVRRRRLDQDLEDELAAHLEMAVADMVPDNPGRWLFHCHVAPHLNAGMSSTFEVLAPVAARD